MSMAALRQFSNLHKHSGVTQRERIPPNGNTMEVYGSHVQKKKEKSFCSSGVIKAAAAQFVLRGHCLKKEPLLPTIIIMSVIANVGSLSAQF